MFCLSLPPCALSCILTTTHYFSFITCPQASNRAELFNAVLDCQYIVYDISRSADQADEAGVVAQSKMSPLQAHSPEKKGCERVCV